MKRIFAGIAIAAGLLIAAAPISSAEGGHNGFDTTVDSTQGNSGKDSPTDGAAASEGTQDTTTTGPQGALKNGNTPDSTVTSTSAGPGNSVH